MTGGEMKKTRSKKQTWVENKREIKSREERIAHILGGRGHTNHDLRVRVQRDVPKAVFGHHHHHHHWEALGLVRRLSIREGHVRGRRHVRRGPSTSPKKAINDCSYHLDLDHRLELGVEEPETMIRFDEKMRRRGFVARLL